MSIPVEQVEQLQLDFEGVEAQDSDVPSMARLLNQLVKESGVDPSQLACVLVSQNYIGSVLKQAIDDIDLDDNEDPEDQPVFAITSMINITSREESVVKDVLKFLRTYIRDLKVSVENGDKHFQELISENDGPETGLLIKERIGNMPIALLHPSLVSLTNDIKTAERRNMPYKFAHFLYWSKMYKEDDQFVHVNVEDAWFDQNSLEYFSYPLKYSDTLKVDDEEIPGQLPGPGAAPFRRVYLVEYSKLSEFIEHVNAVQLG